MQPVRRTLEFCRRCGRWILVRLEHIGQSTAGVTVRIAKMLGVIGVGLWLAVKPGTWTRPVRNVFFRQVLFTAVEAIGLALRFSFALGVLIVVQTVDLTSKISGSDEIIIPVVYHTVVRELVPLIANLIVIGRSSTAMAIEMANMTLDGEVEALDSQGLDPMKYLVMPRMISMSVSVFSLAVVVLFGVFFFGYLMAWMLGIASGDAARYRDSLEQAMEFDDAVFFLTKTVLIGLLVGAVSSTTGLQVRQSSTEVPQAATRAAVRSLTAVFASSAVLSVIFYKKLMMIPIRDFFSSL